MILVPLLCVQLARSLLAACVHLHCGRHIVCLGVVIGCSRCYPHQLNCPLRARVHRPEAKQIICRHRHRGRQHKQDYSTGIVCAPFNCITSTRCCAKGTPFGIFNQHTHTHTFVDVKKHKRARITNYVCLLVRRLSLVARIFGLRDIHRAMNSYTKREKEPPKDAPMEAQIEESQWPPMSLSVCEERSIIQCCMNDSWWPR